MCHYNLAGIGPECATKVVDSVPPNLQGPSGADAQLSDGVISLSVSFVDAQNDPFVEDPKTDSKNQGMSVGIN